MSKEVIGSQVFIIKEKIMKTQDEIYKAQLEMAKIAVHVDIAYKDDLMEHKSAALDNTLKVFSSRISNLEDLLRYYKSFLR